MPWLALAALVIVAVLVFVARGPRPNGTAAAPREAPVDELTQRDGRLHWRDETTPFTGFMIDHYPDGSLLSRSELVNGVLHGVSEGWYTNGVLQVREHFVNGVSHGLRTKWSADGHKLSEATIEHGMITGIFRRWHHNGQIAEEIPMKDGQPDGLALAYYADGSLKSQVLVEAGEVIERFSWKEGEQRDPIVSKAANRGRIDE